MESGRGFRLLDWLPEWLLCLCWCCGLHDERQPTYSSAVPLHAGSSDTYSRSRDDARCEDETLLSKGAERSNAQQPGTHGASTSEASASRPQSSARLPTDKPSTGKLYKHRKLGSTERCKALEDSRFSTLAMPTFSTATSKWDGPPGLVDEDVCAICLEEYEDANPKSFLSCGHAFHLGCWLEWEERGHRICPLCDVLVATSFD